MSRSSKHLKHIRVSRKENLKRSALKGLGVLVYSVTCHKCACGNVGPGVNLGHHCQGEDGGEYASLVSPRVKSTGDSEGLSDDCQGVSVKERKSAQSSKLLFPPGQDHGRANEEVDP